MGPGKPRTMLQLDRQMLFGQAERGNRTFSPLLHLSAACRKGPLVRQFLQTCHRAPIAGQFERTRFLGAKHQIQSVQEICRSSRRSVQEVSKEKECGVSTPSAIFALTWGTVASTPLFANLSTTETQTKCSITLQHCQKSGLEDSEGFVAFTMGETSKG